MRGAQRAWGAGSSFAPEAPWQLTGCDLLPKQARCEQGPVKASRMHPAPNPTRTCQRALRSPVCARLGAGRARVGGIVTRAAALVRAGARVMHVLVISTAAANVLLLARRPS